MVVLIVFTAGFHMILNNSYGSLLYALPLSLKDKTYTPVEGVTEHQHESHGSKAGSSTHEIVKQDRDTDGDVDDDDLRASDKAKDKQPDNAETGQDATARQRQEEAEFGFAHPAISRPQRTVWIPRDSLGLGEEEVAGCEEMGLTASTQGAVMNEKGKVDVPRADEVPRELVANF